MNKQILSHVMPFLDFTNDDNNIKKRDNKKSAYKLKMLKNDSKDLLTQMTLLFYDKIMNNPRNNIVSLEENNVLQKEIDKLNKENEKLKKELKKSNKQIKELEDELKEYDITVNNLDNQIIKLKEKYIIPPSKSNNITDNTPSVLDEPVYYDNTNYDPYNTTYNIPINVSDITSRDMDNIITYYGLGYDEWNDMDDIEKVNYYNEYQIKTDK